MDWGSILSLTNGLIGLIITAVAAGASLITWLYMRGRKDQISEQLDRDTFRKVRAIEDDLGDIRGVLGTHDNRLAHVERQLETVARVGDVAAVEAKVAHLNADVKGVMAEVRIIGGQTDTIYRALVASSSTDK